MATVSISDIRKSFGATQILKGVSVAIEDGEFLSLVGPSGCGKSTLLRIIAGLENQDSGSIAIAGETVDHKRAADRNLSMVFQSYALYPHLTVAENIAVPLKMRQLSAAQRLPLIGPFMPGAARRGKEIGNAVEHAAATLQISHLLGQKPGQLSGGQRQRVAVGRALVRNPAAFLLDEPLSNLDAKLRVHTRAEIAQLHRDLGATFIYVTHDQVEAMTMSDRIAVMMDGELLQVGTPDEIYNAPFDLRVAEFIGSPKIAVLKAETGATGDVTLAGQRLGVQLTLPNSEVKIGIRPETFERCASAEALISGRIRHAENLGSECYLHIETDLSADILVLRSAPGLLREVKIGALIHLTFDPLYAHFFAPDGVRLRENSMVDLRQAVHG